MERREASTSLHEFVAQAWHVIEPATPFEDNWHIGAFCEHLEAVHRGEITRLLINVPPRHLKSTVISVCYPAWKWIHRPAHKFLCGAYALKLSIRDSLAMRRLIQSQWYRERWGRDFNLVDNSDWGDPRGFELSADQNQKTRFDNDRSGYRIAFGFDGGVTGDGGDDVIIDDPHNHKKANSDKERESGILTFRGEVSTRLNHPTKSALIIIMQRLHERDLSGHVLAGGEYEHLLIPMHFDPKRSRVTVTGWCDPRTEAGELLFPQRWTPEAVAAWEKELGPYDAAGQLEQNPSPADGEILQRSWWKFYDVLPAKFDAEAQTWDLAFEGEETSHYTAGQAWGRVGAQAYLKPDEVYEQLDFPNTCVTFAAFSTRHPRGAKLVEKKANGAALLATLKGKIAGLLPVNPDGDKKSRARAVAPYFAAGNVFVPNPYAIPAEAANRGELGPVRPDRVWVLRLIDNGAKYPNGSNPPGSHGDDIDATTQVLHYFFNTDTKPKSRVI